VNVLAHLIDYLIQNFNARVFFLPQTLDVRDITTMIHIFKLVKNKRKIKVITEDYTPLELMILVRHMDLFIGTRMHSNIFALMANVPTIAIAYEHKAYGIMKMMGLEKWVVDINEIDEYKLVSKIEELYKQRFKIKEYVSEKVQEMQTMSLHSAEIIRNQIANTQNGMRA